MAVERDRRGERLNWVEQLLQNALDALPWRREPFASRQQAQSWLEWRRRGWLLACVLGMVMASAVALFPLPTSLYLEPAVVAFNFSLLPLLTIWCARTAGMHLAKSDIWAAELTLHSITAHQPISTGEIVIAKLKVAAKVTILGWIVFGIFSFLAVKANVDLPFGEGRFWARFPTDHGTLMRWAGNPIVIVTVIGLTWHAMIAGMCPALAGQGRKTFWAVGRSLSFFGVMVLIGGWLLRHRENWGPFLAVLPWIAGALVIWKWTLAARAFRMAFRAGLYSHKQCWCLLATGIVLTIGVGASAMLALAAHKIPTPLILFLAAWLFPGGELANCAHNLAQNRHR